MNLRKTICALMFLLIFTGCAALAEAAVDITKQCEFMVSEGGKDALTDKSINTAWKPKNHKASVKIKLPDNGAGYVRIEWQYEPAGFELSQYDSGKNVISTFNEKDAFNGITQVFSLHENARYVKLSLTASDEGVCSIRVYSSGELDKDVQTWGGVLGKCDLLVVSTHQDDEFIFLGGIIPYYNSVREKSVQVMYMADCGRLRRGEALAGLWESGLRNYPDFINLKDKRVKSIKEGVKLWGGKEAILEELVTRIRKYKPEVILTHDWNGEYGHNQHKITARSMQYAIEAAADPEQFPGSYKEYGAWQVKKLYLHLYKENQIDFDWNKAYDELGGKTPLEIAKAAYAKHVSQQEYYKVNDGGKYDNSLFGLAYTTVGADEAHDDLFEHIEETAEPTATEEPAPTAEQPDVQASIATTAPTSEPVTTNEPTAVPSPGTASYFGSATAKVFKIIGIGVGAIAVLTIIQVVMYRVRRNGRRRRY